jgi:hypothetical protein
MSIRPRGWMWPNRRWCSASNVFRARAAVEAVERDPHRPLLALVAQVDLALDESASAARASSSAKAASSVARSTLSRSARNTLR